MVDRPHALLEKMGMSVEDALFRAMAPLAERRFRVREPEEITRIVDETIASFREIVEFDLYLPTLRSRLIEHLLQL